MQPVPGKSVVSKERFASMQRIIVMGPPGSDKSTLARRLGEQQGLPVCHLDQAFWQPGWAKTPADRFRSEVERIAGLPAWVIDGNYTDTIKPRLAAADAVIYLDVPSWLSVLRLLRRTLAGYGRVGQMPHLAVPNGWTWPSCATPGPGTACGGHGALRWSRVSPAASSCSEPRLNDASCSDMAVETSSWWSG